MSPGQEATVEVIPALETSGNVNPALEAMEVAAPVLEALGEVTQGQEGTVESLVVTPGHMVVTRALGVTLAQGEVS